MLRTTDHFTEVVNSSTEKNRLKRDTEWKLAMKISKDLKRLKTSRVRCLTTLLSNADVATPLNWCRMSDIEVKTFANCWTSYTLTVWRMKHINGKPDEAMKPWPDCEREVESSIGATVSATKGALRLAQLSRAVPKDDYPSIPAWLLLLIASAHTLQLRHDLHLVAYSDSSCSNTQAYDHRFINYIWGRLIFATFFKHLRRQEIRDAFSYIVMSMLCTHACVVPKKPYWARLWPFRELKN